MGSIRNASLSLGGEGLIRWNIIGCKAELKKTARFLENWPKARGEEAASQERPLVYRADRDK